MAELATTTAEIETDIRATEAEHDLLANCVPSDRRVAEPNGTGLAALILFLDEANGVVDPAVMLKLRDEI